MWAIGARRGAVAKKSLQLELALFDPALGLAEPLQAAARRFADFKQQPLGTLQLGSL